MDDFHLRWKDYKRRRNQLLFVFVGYVPIMLAFGILSEKLLQTEGNALPSPMTIIAATVVTPLRAAF